MLEKVEMRLILAFFAIAILAMVALAGVQASLEDAGDDRMIENETWTPNAGTVTELEESNRKGAYYADRVNVYNATGVEMDAGSDYEWFVENGTVKALTGGELDGETEATITYEFQQTTKEQREMAGMISHVPQAMGMALPLGALLALLIFARGG